MISSLEVGNIFRIVDEGVAELAKIAAEFEAMQEQIDSAKEA